MTDAKAPERIWANQQCGVWCDSPEDNPENVIYVRADLHDALAKERDELQSERDQALKVSEHRQRNSAETWEAMQTMRNAINEHVPMPSMESDLLQGPENSVFCASVAEAVITGIQARAAAAAMDMRERAAKHAWNKRDLLADAEKKQVEAGLSGRDYYGRRLEAELLSRSIRALPIAPDAQQALDQMLAKAREDAIRLSASIAEVWKAFGGEDYRPVKAVILALLNDGVRDE